MPKRLSPFLLMAALLAALQVTPAGAQMHYPEEYPSIDYAGSETRDPASRLLARVAAGEVELEWREGRGYLDSLLEALEIPVSSQVLVFSGTSLKKRFINAETPRALYFNDEVYISFVQGVRALEIAAMDPELGPVFFTLLNNDPAQPVAAEREMSLCLRCHDSYGNTGGGVPRFLMNSNLVDEAGRIVAHELSEITDTATPIARRWGGHFVTGKHGGMRHLGNLVIREPAMLQRLTEADNGNRLSLEGLVDTSSYPAGTSDIVALLVLEHQVELQNLITRVHYDVETLLHREGLNEATRAQVATMVEPLVESLLMAHEAPLTAPVEGSNSFADDFEARGPLDSRGRSLRQLELETRTFRYPLSYLVYSPAFLALPEAAREAVYARLDAILAGADAEERWAHLDAATRSAISEILLDTHEDYRRFCGRAS